MKISTKNNRLKVSTTLLTLCFAFFAMSFTIGSKNAGIVAFKGDIVNMQGEKVENVRIKIFVDGEYHSYRFIENGSCDFTLPKQGEVKLHFCHKTMAEKVVSVDTKINEKMKGATVEHTVKMHRKSIAEKVATIHDFKNEPVAHFTLDSKGVGVNEIESTTKSINEQVASISKEWLQNLAKDK